MLTFVNAYFLAGNTLLHSIWEKGCKSNTEFNKENMAYSWKLKGSLFETLSLRRSVSQKFDEAELQRLLEARLPPKVRGTLLSTEEIHHNEVERQWKVTLRRYLQAESWSVQQAESRILQHASWREQIMPWSINEVCWMVCLFPYLNSWTICFQFASSSGLFQAAVLYIYVSRQLL